MNISYIYGFNKRTPDKTGYLKILPFGPDLYEIVDDESDATAFETKNRRRKLHWASPEKWCEFFNGEQELSGWRFHTVTRTVR